RRPRSPTGSGSWPPSPDRRSAGNPVAAGGDHVPLGAELVQALPGGVAGLAVAGVVVERVAVVGHLGAAVAGNGAEQPAGHAAPGLRGAAAQVRRPGAG